MYKCFFDVFIAVAVVVATALYFDLKGHMQCHDKWKNPKCIKLYIVKLLVIMKNVPVLLRGTFYTHSVSAMKLSSLNEDMKNHEYFVI